MTDAVTITIERPDQPEIVTLVEALDAHASALYPPESNHFLDIAALCAPAITFLVAREGGAALGIGAVLHDARGWGEIKRMFVVPRARGRRIGKRILQRLETHALGLGLTLFRLETGIHNTEALAAYRAAGYRERAPFGDYAPDPLSVFMEKAVVPGTANEGRAGGREA